MSFWKKLGTVTLDIGVAAGKGLISIGEEASRNKNLSDEQLKEKNEDTGFFSKTTSMQRKLAELEIKKRSKTTS